MADGEKDEGPGFRWRNWSREQRCRPFEIARPRTREGMIRTVVDAAEAGRGVKVVGSGHSFSETALTDGTMLEIGLVDRILDIDRVQGLVKVEAGIVLGDLNRRLHGEGIALENLGDIDRQTLAGSISTATHGTGARFGNLSSQIHSLELIGADGTLHELSEDSDPDGFRAARVGIGALGAIYSVTLRAVPAYRIDRTDQPRPLEETLDRLDELADSIDHFEFYVFPYTDVALCRESTRTDAPPEPESRAVVFAREVMLENWVGGVFATAARRAPGSAPTIARIAAKGTGRSHKLEDSYRVYASERRIKFTEMEYCIPRENAREAIERTLEIASRRELGIAWPIEVRFVAADDALLSPSHDRDSCYIAVHADPHGEWMRYFGMVSDVMADYEGRPHWGKRNPLDAGDLAKLYPRFDDFLAVRERLDPGGVFANDYTERVLGPVAVPAEHK